MKNLTSIEILAITGGSGSPFARFGAWWAGFTDALFGDGFNPEVECTDSDPGC